VGSVRLGARTVDQLEGTLGSTEGQLSDDELARLTSVSAPGLAPYPYGMIQDLCDLDHWRTLGT